MSRKHLPGQGGREAAGSLQGGVDLLGACSFLQPRGLALPSLGCETGMWRLLAVSLPGAQREAGGPGSSPRALFSIRQRTNAARRRHAADARVLQHGP